MLDRNELVDAYWSTVAPAMRDGGLDPEAERPTHEWLSTNGFRGLVYALREHHDRTFGEFWRDDLGLGSGEAEYDWGTEHDETVRLLEAFVRSRRERGELSERTERTARYRLGRYVRTYVDVNDAADLLAPVARDSSVPAHEATDAAWATFDRLDEELAPTTVRRIHETADDWYAHLVRRKRAAVNPVAGLEDEFRWSRRIDDGPANPALDPDHVRRLYDAAAAASERLLVVALCAWGLRSGEVAELERERIELDPEDSVPYVDFDRRKNGPGRVSILYGVDAAETRLRELDDAAQFCFPSRRSSTGHVSRQTVLNWFDDLAGRAGLPEEIGGRKPVPQMGRRFWYDAYSAAQEAVLDAVGDIAAEQGSASAEVVLGSYLSEERRRRLRREYMREQLSAAFDGT
jgi:integrase